MGAETKARFAKIKKAAKKIWAWIRGAEKTGGTQASAGAIELLSKKVREEQKGKSNNAKGKGETEKSGNKEYKTRKKVKGKKKDDIPDRYKHEKPYKGEAGKDAAKRVLQEHGEYDPKSTGPRSLFNQLKKHFDHDFE